MADIRTIEIYEDNAGGIHAAIFDADGNGIAYVFNLEYCGKKGYLRRYLRDVALGYEDIDGDTEEIDAGDGKVFTVPEIIDDMRNEPETLLIAEVCMPAKSLTVYYHALGGNGEDAFGDEDDG